MKAKKLKTYACLGTTQLVKATSAKAAQAKFAKYLVGQVRSVKPRKGDKGVTITQKDIQYKMAAGRRFLKRRAS